MLFGSAGKDKAEKYTPLFVILNILAVLDLKFRVEMLPMVDYFLPVSPVFSILGTIYFAFRVERLSNVLALL